MYQHISEIVLCQYIARFGVLFYSCVEFPCVYVPAFMSLLLMDPQGVFNLLPLPLEL